MTHDLTKEIITAMLLKTASQELRWKDISPRGAAPEYSIEAGRVEVRLYWTEQGVQATGVANDGIPVIQAHSSQYEEAEVLYQAAEKTTKERVKRQLAMIARLGGKTREKNPTREAMGQLADALGRATGNGEITWERTTGNAERPDRFEAEVDEAKCLLLSQGNLLKDKTVLTILENDRVIGELDSQRWRERQPVKSLLRAAQGRKEEGPKPPEREPTNPSREDQREEWQQRLLASLA